MYKTWSEGFLTLAGDLNDDQKNQLLGVMVHGTAGRVLDQRLTGNDYNAAARTALIRRTLDGTYDTPEILRNCVQGPKERFEGYLHR